MKSDKDNKPFFKHILNDIFKQPFTITEMYHERTQLCYNRDYKSLTKGTRYIIIEYRSNVNCIDNIYVGIKRNNKRNKGIFFDSKFNPFGYVNTRDYNIYPQSEFYMITL